MAGRQRRRREGGERVVNTVRPHVCDGMWCYLGAGTLVTYHILFANWR
jgi:hypothetical protein